VTVNVHEDQGRFYARSEELLGLILSYQDRGALLEIIPKAMEALYRRQGYTTVKITPESSSADVETGPGAGFQRYAVELSK
jgi:hypothetical protein